MINMQQTHSFHLALNLVRCNQDFLSLSHTQKTDFYKAYVLDHPDAYSNILLLNTKSLNTILSDIVSHGCDSRVLFSFSSIFNSLVSKELDAEIESIIDDAREYLNEIYLNRRSLCLNLF